MEKKASEITRSAKEFVKKWTGKGREKQDDKTFWEDLLEDVFGIQSARNEIDVQKIVKFNGTTKYIDVYIKRSRVVIEQKSHGIDLLKPEPQSDGTPLTPLQQGKRYYDWLDKPLQGRYIVTCNFQEFRVFDNYHKTAPENVVPLSELPKRWRELAFLTHTSEETASEISRFEEAVARTASDYVRKLYASIVGKRKDLSADEQHSLNVFCVRVVFCLFAEDAGLFDNRQFRRFIEKFDVDELSWRFGHLFEILDDKCRTCCRYAPKELTAFPYVDGGLFKHDPRYTTPPITVDTRNLLLNAWNITMPGTKEPFHWADISPNNFGCIFESTAAVAVRASGGMHYTTPENIQRVIGPLFLDKLREELDVLLSMPASSGEERQKAYKAMEAYRDRLAGLRFLDPACGSGNFLTETYRSLHELELEVIKAEQNLNFQTSLGNVDPCRVQISQFYGIEIDDFAASVAKASLWIAECQMLQKTEEVLECHLDMLPLPKNANILCADALTTDWNTVLRPGRTLPIYIIGNPPFQGYSVMTAEQKQSMLAAMPSTLRDKKVWNSQGKMDFVCGWYAKAAEYMRGTSMVSAAFVSTNSITQGEQVAWLWKPLMKHYRMHIDFAWRTFRWDNEAENKAHVHCVIIGFSKHNTSEQRILFEEGCTPQMVPHINGYLLNGEDLFIESRTKPIADVPLMVYGNKIVDGGHLVLEPDEYKKLTEQEPAVVPYVRQLLGAREFLHNELRYCLWLVDAPPHVLNLPQVKARITAVEKFRRGSSKADTREWANLAYRFVEIRQPATDYIVVPRVSSENRRYVPMGFVASDIICSDANQMIPSPTLWLFGILQSRIHMAWLRYVCGRLKSDYRYSANVVYNNFPVPTLNEEQCHQIEQTAQGILDARGRYAEESLADMYNVMKEDLLRAHRLNDRAVADAFGLDLAWSDEQIALELMRRSIAMSKPKPKKKGKRKTKLAKHKIK
ncbi:MAG: class I SAM-dependent DNA methyltransferase [Prevotella sp.]|nr:class I SAM-dependent DNA methyltransferase [Prevotella sp.]